MKLAVSRGARRLLLAAAVCLAAVPAGATSYMMIEDGALVEDSALIVEARVLSADPAPATRLPAQDYMIEVERVLSGEPTGRNLVVRVPGGRSEGGLVWHVEGVPRFAVGEQVLLFLIPQPDGVYGVRHLMLGAFHEAVAGGERLFVRDLTGARELGGESSGRALYRQARKADAFSRWVSDRARGVEREPDYFVEETEADVVASVTAAFRLFDNEFTGLNIRWFAFDEGADLTCPNPPRRTIRRNRALDFVIVAGGQPGYTEPQTANALRSGLEAWNRASETLIRYRYGGTIASSPGFEDCPAGQSGGVCLDGHNAVLYDNADGSIMAGPFNCTGGGGTLAVGGPIYDDRCRLPGPQNRDFHPSIEAEIITNEGIECVVNTQRDLEELFGHELGHTLGIHHPCQTHPCGTPLEKDALMYPVFHGDGRGAQLNADDLAAVRYLYPGDTGGAKPPAAPSGLAAVALSPTSVELTWTDNSTDETSFRIEARQGAGTFGLIGTTGANVTSFVVIGLLPDTTYTFRVQARNAAGGSGFTDVTLTTAPDLPAAPANLVAAPDSSTTVGLTWDDLATNETGFRIEMRSPLTGAWVEVGLAAPNAETFMVPGLVADRPYTFRVIAVNGAGESAPSNSASATPQPVEATCETTDTTVCLLDRFRVTIHWNNPHGAGGNGVGHTALFPGSDRTATAWFFSPDNVEVIVKVLDGSAVNDFFWVFHGQLTDVEFWVTVLDTESGFSTTYHNPPFDRCGEFDNAAIPAEAIPFESSALAAAGPLTATPAPAIDPETGACVPDEETLCLLGGRFAAQVGWTNQHAEGTPSGEGQTLPSATTDRAGYFWFFNPANVELVVKVLQAGDTFWVFYGSLSDVEYTLTVTDTETDRTKTYTNAPGHTCGQFDTAAFPPEEG